MLECAIVTNELGIVEYFNKSAEQLLGFAKAEVIGQNVKKLMPSPYHEEHDQYLRSYLQTGQRKVIGTGRDVIAQRKDGKAPPSSARTTWLTRYVLGSVIPVRLSVTEQEIAGRKRFTGMYLPMSHRVRIP